MSRFYTYTPKPGMVLFTCREGYEKGKQGPHPERYEAHERWPT